jgi:hypothetical protein
MALPNVQRTPISHALWNPAWIVHKNLLHIKRHERQNKRLNKTTSKRLANDCLEQADDPSLASDRAISLRANRDENQARLYTA